MFNLRDFTGNVLVGLCILGVLMIPCSLKAEEDLSPAAKEVIENTMSLLAKVMEKAILESTAKAMELLPDAKKKSDEELNAVMDKAVKEITQKILKDEKFEEAVIEAVSRCAEEAFSKGVEEALKQEKGEGKN